MLGKVGNEVCGGASPGSWEGDVDGERDVVAEVGPVGVVADLDGLDAGGPGGKIENRKWKMGKKGAQPGMAVPRGDPLG